MSPENRSGRRLRVTSPLPHAEPSAADTAPEIGAIQGVLEVSPERARSIWRVVGKLGVVITILGAVAGGAVGIGMVTASAKHSEEEQAEIARDVKSINERLSRMEGALQILLHRKEAP